MARKPEEEKEALAAVSSLKRALGISNHPTKRDEFKLDELQNPICHIYTPDEESAILLGELLHRIAITPKGSAYYDSIRPRTSQRDTIKVQYLEDGGCESAMWVHEPEKFSRSVQRIIEKHIGPDKTGGHRR